MDRPTYTSMVGIDRSFHLGRIGERYEIDVVVEIELPKTRGVLKRRPIVLQGQVRNLSVSGALLAVPADSGIERGQQVSVDLGGRRAPMRVVRVAAGATPGTVDVAVAVLREDTQWGAIVDSLVGGPDAPTGLRWLGGVG